MCLSTSSRRRGVDGRIVLLKGVVDEGFVFYTNVTSAKGRALKKNSRCSLTFYWDALARQVRVRGRAVLVGNAEADAYFASRPRMSQIAAWASRQSAVLPNRAVLLQRAERFRALFKGRRVPRPPFWHGFRVIPDRIEFWRGRAHRLHDRFLYVRKHGNRWALRRLYP